MPDTTTPPDAIDEFKAAAEARTASRAAKAAGGKPATPAAPAVEAKEEKPSPPPVETSAADAKASGGDESEKPVEPAQPPDAEWLPENLRGKAKGIDPELAKFLKANVMRRSEYERWTKAEKAPLEESAGKWRTLEKHPRAKQAMDAMYRALNGIDGGEAEPVKDDGEITVPDDFDPFNPKHVTALVAKVARGEAQKASKEAVAESWKQRVDAPKAVVTEISQAVLAWADDEQVDDATLTAATKLANEWVQEVGIEWTPVNAPKILKRFVAEARASTPTKPRGTDGKFAPNGTSSGGLSGVASPASRGSAAIPPSDVPMHIRKGEKAKTNAEREAGMAHILRENFGVSLTPDQLRNWGSR